MERLSITPREMKLRGPCKGYSLTRLNELWAGRKRLTALDILDLDIPAADKLWGVLHESLIGEGDLHELACRFAEAALLAELDAGREPDPASWNAIDAKRMWLDGFVTDEELAAAGSAAARSVAGSAVAGSAVARSAVARLAAGLAAGLAAAGLAAARSVAARSAACARQVQLVRDYMVSEAGKG